MKNHFSAILLALGVVLSAAMAHAEPINYAEISAGGFSDVAALLQQMTPAQQAQVMAAAQARAKEMQDLTPDQQLVLQEQMRHIANTLKIGEIDPNKLNVDQSKDFAATQSDMAKYDTLYSQGKLNNSAVKTHAESQEE